MYPQFLGIGVQKAGTSWLNANLRYHEQIWMPPVKTVRYFNEPSRLPLALRALLPGRENDRWRNMVKTRTSKLLRRQPEQHLLWYAKYLLLPRTDSWYASLFRPQSGQIAGEVTPAYCRMPHNVVQHIHALMPDARIIYLIRNPIERMWSHAAMRFGKKRIKLEDVADDTLSRWMETEAPQRYSDVSGCLSVWRSYYGTDQFYVGFFDRLVADPGRLLRSIYEFLQVDSSDRFVPREVKEKQNAGSYRPIPQRFLGMMSRKHHDQLKELHAMFDNEFTARWLQQAEEGLQ